MILFSNSPNTLSEVACFILPKQLSCYPLNAKELKHCKALIFLEQCKVMQGKSKGLILVLQLIFGS